MGVAVIDAGRGLHGGQLKRAFMVAKSSLVKGFNCPLMQSMKRRSGGPLWCLETHDELVHMARGFDGMKLSTRCHLNQGKL